MLLPTALFVLALGLPVALGSPSLYALLYGMANGMITIVKATADGTYYVSRATGRVAQRPARHPDRHRRALAPSPLPPCGRPAATTSSVSPSPLLRGGVLATVAFWMAQFHNQLRKA